MTFLDRHRALATAFLASVIVFTWKMAVIIQTLQAFDQLWTPPKVSDVLMAFVFAAIAFASGIGINIRSLLFSFGLVADRRAPDPDAVSPSTLADIHKQTGG